jgi:alpha-L-fucosidase
MMWKDRAGLQAALPCWCLVAISLVIARADAGSQTADQKGSPPSALRAEPATAPEHVVAAPIPDTIETVAGTSTNAGRVAALARWQEAKFGLFLHWGVYSVYGGTCQGKELWSAEWIQENARIPWAEYSETAAQWNPSDFDAEAWVKTAKAAGMRYVVLTAKHHDGFAIYPSKASKYNLMDWSQYRGPDPLVVLKDACHKHGLLFGLYYSPLEFRVSPNGFDADDEKAVAAGFRYETLGPKPYASNADVVKLAKAQIKELAENYQPDIFWFDGTWDKMGVWSEADAKECEAVIRAAAPNVLVNNRLGVKAVDFKTYEHKFPTSVPGQPWEYCWNLGVFWGYNPRNYSEKNLGTPESYIETLVRVASLGGNYLLNVGPDSTGKLSPMAVNYLERIGKWIAANEECVRGTQASPFKEKPAWGYVTCRPGKLYLIVKDPPADGSAISLPALGTGLPKASFLGDHSGKTIRTENKDGRWLVHTDAPSLKPFIVIVLTVDRKLDLQAGR